MKKYLAILLAVLCLLTIAGCAKSHPLEVTCTVTRDEKYNSATMSVSPEEFEAAGFQLGDSCDIEFGNGYCLTDVPFYDGYYVKTGAPVLVSYPGFDYLFITLNNLGIWDAAGLSENESMTVRLNQAGKYSDVQETLGQVYSFAYSDYSGSVEFCNFRALSGGDLKEGFLFRGASPVDNSRGRASYTDRLLEENGISFVIDLADSEEDMTGYLLEDGFDSPYTKELFECGRVTLLSMSSAYATEAYQQKVVEGMKAMLDCASGPVYIHCMEGKDRTGFVCTLLEALAGASYEEMRRDYMKTYENYYSVSATETPEKYQAIAELYFDSFVACLHGTEDLTELEKADYVQDAVNYLMAGGMTREEAGQLRKFITK